jgi:hypothetical protein
LNLKKAFGTTKQAKGHEKAPVPCAPLTTLSVNGANAAQARFRTRLSYGSSVSWFYQRPFLVRLKLVAKEK